jgi:hypothetical protein
MDPRHLLASVEAEFRRYKSLAEKAVEQLADDELHVRWDDGNSIAILMQHIGGNLKSRFSDFLSSDGEKPWRDRESEFADRRMNRTDLLATWEGGWQEALTSLGSLTDEQMTRPVVIRGVELSVVEALHRSVTHVSYHVGQIVLLARRIRGSQWKFLSIPPGRSAEYNANPTLEKPPK